MESVFQAVADPTRRALLERLRRSGPLAVKQLAAGLPMSRQAVTKHLDTLTAAGLVTIERRGRERIHHLETAPLRRVDEWLQPYAEQWDARLERLERHLAGGPTHRRRKRR